MSFISYEDIEKIYGDVETFIHSLINRSRGSTWCHGTYGTSGVPGIWFSYDTDTALTCNNTGRVLMEE